MSAIHIALDTLNREKGELYEKSQRLIEAFRLIAEFRPEEGQGEPHAQIARFARNVAQHILAEHAPTHTDMMVPPESLDAFMEANPCDCGHEHNDDILSRLNDDAHLWAQEFMKVARRGVPIDEELMVAWFANAIERACDVRRIRKPWADMERLASASVFRHKLLGSYYLLIGDGTLQTSEPLKDDAELIAYRGEDGRLWFRPTPEFESRFDRC